MPPSDRFLISIPSEFSVTAQSIWANAKAIASEDHYHAVFPWHLLIAWLELEESQSVGISGSTIREVYNSRISRAVCRQDLCCELQPTYALAEIFSRSLIDSYRFSGVIDIVSHKWIIPNLFDAIIALPIALSNDKHFAKDLLLRVLSALGDGFIEHKTHYIFRTQVSTAEGCSVV